MARSISVKIIKFLMATTLCSCYTSLFSEQDQQPVEHLTLVPQVIKVEERNPLHMFLQKPIEFTRSGMQSFLQEQFSHPEYPAHVLPHSFSHLVDILLYGKNNHQNILFLESTLRLFGNRAKMCPYVSADELNKLLEKFPMILECHFVKTPVSLVSEVKMACKRIMYDLFLSKFGFFKNDPDSFFDDLSASLLQEFTKSQYMQTTLDKEQVRQQVIRFLEIALNKVLWSPYDQQEVWIHVKRTSEYLHQLLGTSILNADDLDDLYQSLIARFIYFLDLAGSELNLETIDMIKADILEKRLLLFTLKEQEDFIEPKAERLKSAIERTEARIIARMQTDIVA